MNSYLKSPIEKVESINKRRRWKAHFHGNNSDERNQSTHDADADSETDDKYGFKSRKCPPQHEDLDRFQADLMDMVNNIRFRKTQDKFQTQLNKDIQRIKSSTKAFIPANKTTSLYELDKTQHKKLIQNSITTTYKKASKGIIHSINQEAKAIATLVFQQRSSNHSKNRAALHQHKI